MKYIKLTILLILQIQLRTIAEAHELFITADDIHQSGITRLGDIFMLINDWHVNTIDGYTWNVSINDLNLLQHQNWIIMIDGQKVGIFGEIHPEVLNNFELENPVAAFELEIEKIMNEKRIF